MDQVMEERKAFGAALKGLPYQRGYKGAQGQLNNKGKGKAKTWWCPILEASLSLVELNDKLVEYDVIMTDFDQQLEADKNANKDGSPLNKAFKEIAFLKDLEMMPEPPKSEGGKGTGGSGRGKGEGNDRSRWRQQGWDTRWSQGWDSRWSKGWDSGWGRRR